MSKTNSKEHPESRHIQRQSRVGIRSVNGEISPGDKIHLLLCALQSFKCITLGFLECTELESSSKTMTEFEIVSANLEGACDHTQHAVGHLVIFLLSVLLSHCKAFYNLS